MIKIRIFLIPQMVQAELTVLSLFRKVEYESKLERGFEEKQVDSSHFRKEAIMHDI